MQSISAHEKSEVETVSKTSIKPSSPTHQSLSHYNLSSNDQRMYSLYGSLAFFYVNPSREISTIRQQLRNSLSKTLAPYYPFAGRLVKNDYIDCSDQGVEFLEVRIHCPIHDILKKTRSDAVDLVFPRGIVAQTEDSLIAVQLSHFDCGGVAVAICISHKVADGSTAVGFIENWAASTRLSSHIPAPLLVADSLFPFRDDIRARPFVPSQKCFTRRIVFPPAEIEKLKSKAIESGIQQPTRVEVVTALLFQCIMIAETSTNYGMFWPSVILLPINLRPFLALPQTSVGNIFSLYFCIIEDERMEFPALVAQLSKAKLKFQNLPREKLSYESQVQGLGECLKQLNITSFNVYLFSSLCGFPINNVDFGWGKPTWTSTMQSRTEEIILFDSPENGVEALVTLEAEKMSAFESNEKLLHFASSDSAKWKSRL